MPLLERVREEQERILELIERLVKLEGPTRRKDLVDRVSALVADEIRRNGLEPHLVPSDAVGDLVWTEWEEGNGAGRLLLLCHLDTVWEEGSLERNPFRIEEGRVFGPGIFDMKSGVAATLKVQEYIHRGWIRPRRRVRFVYTTDEETGSRHSRALIEEFARESEAVLILEPPLPDGAVKTFRKGVGSYRIRIHGRRAHAGLEPEKGLNALEELARQILRIHSLGSRPSGTTVNVTVAQGGSTSNVIPERAEALVDLRFRTMEEGRRVDEAVRGLKAHQRGISLQIEGGIDRPPMVPNQETRRLFETARRLAAELGLELGEGESGGGSDGNFTAALGVPTLDGLGIPGDGAHAWHEHVRLDQIPARVALLARLVERL